MSYNVSNSGFKVGTQDPYLVGGVDVSPLDCVCDLGVTLDSQLTMKQHTDIVARSCFYQLRQLRSVRRSLTLEALRTVVQAFVISRVDYCNAVLYGVAVQVIRRHSALNTKSRSLRSTASVAPAPRTSAMSAVRCRQLPAVLACARRATTTSSFLDAEENATDLVASVSPLLLSGTLFPLTSDPTPLVANSSVED